MATDAKTGQPIFGGHNSWGRTRSPKNLAGTQGGTITPLQNVNGLRGITADTVGSLGYATENQRYLHILIEDSNEDDNETVTAFGYCHAFLRWFPLMTTIGGTTPGQSGTQEISLTGEDADLAPSAQTPGLRTYRVYEIAGVDRVAFVCADASEVNIFAACSTF